MLLHNLKLQCAFKQRSYELCHHVITAFANTCSELMIASVLEINTDMMGGQ